MEEFMDNFSEQYGRLDEILKEIQQPGMTMEQATVLYNEGSSILNLFDYNKPVLVEAIAKSDILATTIIGHETDPLLCDDADDIHFSTPTDAARQLSKKAKALRTDIRKKEYQLQSIYSRIVTQRERELEKKRLHDNNRILTITLVIAVSALLMMLIKKFLQ